MLDIGQWSPMTVALAVGALTLLVLHIWNYYRYLTTFRRMGIPGPIPLPFMGNMLIAMKKDTNEVFMDWQKEHGKIYGVFFPNPMLVIGDKDLSRDVLVKKFSVFADRPKFAGFSTGSVRDNLLSLTGDHWKHVRNQLSPTFSSNKMKKILPAIARVAKNLNVNLKNKVDKDQMLELKDLCQNIAMDIIAGVAFGLEVDSLHNSQDQFSKHAGNMVDSFRKKLPILTTFPWLEKILYLLNMSAFPKKDSSYLVGVIEAALEDRRKDKKKYGDFLQLLVDSEKTGGQHGQVDAEIDFRQQLTTSTQWTRKGLTSSEMHANSIIFLFAGYETVSAVLSLVLFALAANPECLRKAQKEVDEKIGKSTPDYETAMDLTYIDMCMNEAMRLYVPFVHHRITSEDFDLGGYHVPKGMHVCVPACVLHHDPDEWPEPGKFDPERFTAEERAKRNTFSFMPFGMGPRNCIGMRLAQLEIRFIIGCVLQSFTPVLCEKSVVPPVLKPMSAETKDGLWVRFKHREAAQ